MAKPSIAVPEAEFEAASTGPACKRHASVPRSCSIGFMSGEVTAHWATERVGGWMGVVGYFGWR